jgi:hypothetical protein
LELEQLQNRNKKRTGLTTEKLQEAVIPLRKEI